jgi:HNH endonuclease
VSVTPIAAALRRQVIERAGNSCEYCLLQADVTFFPFEIDHVIAEKHGGKTELDNLAFSCWRCNRHKGTDLGSFDPDSQSFSLLFNPRLQIWAEHFRFEGERLIGLTPQGRTTVRLLRLNSENRLAERNGIVNR